jgi:hypothetical protein
MIFLGIVRYLMHLIRHMKSRQSAHPKGYVEPPVERDEVDNLRLLIQRAQGRLDLQTGEIDRHEYKVLAFVALALALAALLTSLGSSLQPWWWIPVIGLGLSVSLLRPAVAQAV